MKFGHKNLALALVASGVMLWSATSAHAVEVTFTLDPVQSILTQTEIFLNTLGVPLAPQDPGVSETSTGTGEIVVDVDDVNNPSSIFFNGGIITFSDNGDWLPGIGGGTPGDPGTPASGGYATQFVDEGLGVTFYSVYRGASFSLLMYDENHFGEPIVPDPIPVTAGEFPWDDTNSRVLADNQPGGLWEWNLGGSFGDDSGSETTENADNINIATDPGTYSVAGNIATLTIPFHVRWGEDPDGDPSDLLAIFEGTLVATANLSGGFDEGDFDEDGDVDGDDFLAWQSGFGTTSGATKADGDYDNDGDVDGDDFLGWQSEFGNGGGSGAVPEPSSIVLVVLAALGCGFTALRKRLA